MWFYLFIKHFFCNSPTSSSLRLKLHERDFIIIRAFGTHRAIRSQCTVETRVTLALKLFYFVILYDLLLAYYFCA